MTKTLLISGIFLLFCSIFLIGKNVIGKNRDINSKTQLFVSDDRFWKIQSIDTMKFSRDTAREKIKDPTYDAVIDAQVNDIAETGVTHVAIATPYDEEFVPFLERWVKSARKHNLKVWFRGNLSGWEGWFEYPKINRATHIEMIKKFILAHPDLFEDGDIFVSCPECENGGPGDPRMIGDAEGHKQFLIQEYSVVKEAFKEIDKDIIANYYSMNGDVARLIMDRETTAALDGVVSIDHYVNTPEKLLADIHDYAVQSGGKVVLGEWGVPIPDINGEMTEEVQADYIDRTFKLLMESRDIEAINYWVNRGGSTELWNGENMPRKGVTALTKYFNPKVIAGTITDRRGNAIANVTFTTKYKTVTSKSGSFTVPVLDNERITITKDGYDSRTIDPSVFTLSKNIVLEKSHPSFMDRLSDYFSKLFRRAN